MDSLLTKAYITSTPSNDSTLFQVRVPIMEDNTGNEALFDAYLCAMPGIYNGFNVGDCVYVHFEDTNQNVCVILGKLYSGIPTADDSYVFTSDLKVSNSAILPADTKFVSSNTQLGSYSVEDFTKLYNSVLIGGAGGSSSGGGGSSADVEELKRKINFKDWVIEQPMVQSSSGEVPGPNLNFYRKFKGMVG